MPVVADIGGYLNPFLGVGVLTHFYLILNNFFSRPQKYILLTKFVGQKARSIALFSQIRPYMSIVIVLDVDFFHNLLLYKFTCKLFLTFKKIYYFKYVCMGFIVFKKQIKYKSVINQKLLVVIISIRRCFDQMNRLAELL